MSAAGEVTSSNNDSNQQNNTSATVNDPRLMSHEDKLKADELMQLFREKFYEPPVVVDLDRAEKDGKKQKCLNVQCESENELFLPPEYARKYYYQPKGKNQFICKECLNKAAQFFKDAEDDFREGKSVFAREFPVGNEVIVVDDEDDESESLTLQAILKGGDHKLMYKFVNSSEMTKMIEQVCISFDYNSQKEDQLEMLNAKMDKFSDEFDLLEESFKKGQETLFLEMRSLYETYKPERKDLEPYEVPYEEMRSPNAMNTRNEEDCIFTGLITDTGPSNLPPSGTVEKPELHIGQTVFVMKVAVFSEWIPAVIEEIIDKNVHGQSFRHYKVALSASKHSVNVPGRPNNYKKEVSAQLIAYHYPLPVRFPFGARVISEYVYKSKDITVYKRYYSGMVAEIPSGLNNYRYLIFFDDGRVQYVCHSQIRLICEVKPCIWEHFAPKVQGFIKRYLLTFPERAMLKVKNLDCVKTECRGFWVNARVVQVDCSLVYLFFLHDKHFEWLYRGSIRLYPMWLGSSKKTSVDRPRGFAARRTTSGPYVQYENIVVDDDEKDNTQRPVARAVARKSSTQVADIEVLENSTRKLYDRSPRISANEQRDGVLMQSIPSKAIAPKLYRPHPCSNSCISSIHTTDEDIKGMNPLGAPTLYGFSRETDVASNKVVYVAPCGRKMESIAEVLKYLTQTNFKLSIDMFDFDPWVNIYNEYVVPNEHMVLKDLSFGVENIPIVCVNTLDTEVPKYMDYMTNRRSTEGVNLNLDPEFLVGCDCTDNCQDKEKCACWRLTLSEGNCTNISKIKDFHTETIGYQYKRLPNLVATGIYECNVRCKCCVKTCLNRVVQHPLKHKLQLFKTKFKGWGTRCLNDIPAGTFICVYVGNIFTESVANEDGRLYGDEYFAELDYIEVVEANKEGYEDYIDPDPDSRENDTSREYVPSDDEYDDPPSSLGMNLRKRKQTSQQASNSEDEDDPDEVSNESSDGAQFRNSVEEMSDIAKKYPSVRSLYGENESVYIMDAKHSGNIGRYLNHSCDPNIFVQNVFVDTHDLRFPWVAFFSFKYIRAGTELTWDYRYEVDSVPGKKLKCYCLADNCRGRLL